MSEIKKNTVVFYAFILLILCLLCGGCTTSDDVETAETELSNNIEPSADVPVIYIEYTLDGEELQMQIAATTSSWKIEQEDGTGVNANSDGSNPLDSTANLEEIEKTDELTALKISFSLIQESYTVRCWPDNYIGQPEAYEDYYEQVDVSEDTIVLPNDGQGYVYEVYAIWSQGEAYYSFYVVNT